MLNYRYLCNYGINEIITRNIICYVFPHDNKSG